MAKKSGLDIINAAITRHVRAIAARAQSRSGELDEDEFSQLVRAGDHLRLVEDSRIAGAAKVLSGRGRLSSMTPDQLRDMIERASPGDDEEQPTGAPPHN